MKIHDGEKTGPCKLQAVIASSKDHFSLHNTNDPYPHHDFYWDLQGFVQHNLFFLKEKNIHRKKCELMKFDFPFKFELISVEPSDSAKEYM